MLQILSLQINSIKIIQKLVRLIADLDTNMSQWVCYCHNVKMAKYWPIYQPGWHTQFISLDNAHISKQQSGLTAPQQVAYLLKKHKQSLRGADGRESSVLRSSCSHHPALKSLSCGSDEGWETDPGHFKQQAALLQISQQNG